MLKYAFVREGWKLIPAKTGEERLKALRSKGADYIILDIMLPRMALATGLGRSNNDRFLEKKFGGC